MITLYLLVTLASGQSVVFQEQTDTYLTCRSLGDQMVKTMLADEQFIAAEYKCVVPNNLAESRSEYQS